MSGPAKPTTNHPRGKIVIGEPAKEEVLGFLASTFQSVWALEVLCLLRQNRSRSVAHAEIVSSLRGSDLIVNQSVRTLVAAGLVVVEDDGGARYTPVTPAIERLVDAAVGMYAKRPDAVRRVIVSAANPNITAFADAFRLRKD